MFQQVPQRSAQSFWNRARNSAAAVTLAVLDSELFWRRQKETGTGSTMILPRSMAAAINWKEAIQQRYGLAKDLVRKDVDDWLDAQP